MEIDYGEYIILEFKTKRRRVEKKLPVKNAKKSTKCPKCGGKMIDGVCSKCKYSPKSAYRNRAEAKEFTVAG